MTEARRDPEALLRKVMAEERRARRGRLKVFLGYSSRVGKTWRMLDEARRRKARGQDVVVGWLQHADDPEVRGMLGTLEFVPPLTGPDGIPDMDVAGIIQRAPQCCVVDELAHANAPGSRHAFRWQDVEEILDAGITVNTAINVQFLEGVKDQVEALLGIRKTDSVPDAFIQGADEVVLVDVSPEEVQQRTYATPDGHRGTLDESTLSRLRELALLHAADTIDQQVEDYRQKHHIETVWATCERILVCVTAHARGPAMVERGYSTARRLHGELHVIYVTPDLEWSNLDLQQRLHVQNTLALARTCQATVDVVQGTPAEAVLDYARKHNITQIYVGHTGRRRLPSLLSRSVVGRIIHGAEGIDVHVVSNRRPPPGGDTTAALTRPSPVGSSTSLPLFRARATPPESKEDIAASGALPVTQEDAATHRASPVGEPGGPTRQGLEPTPQQQRDTDGVPRPCTRKGRLKIYLGYAAGVGKTFQMLNDGNALKARGHDVVIGYFEPHERADTMAEVGALETVPRRQVAYRDRDFEEMDLPAVLARHPEICLVDELAHSNIPGVENPKRWQDVQAMVDAGITVYSTMNIQHLESLNDQVHQITGVKVRETVPDRVTDQADEIVLVDVTTRALLNRLQRGVVYPLAKASQALQNFFREGNLSALREMALRQAADKVERERIIQSGAIAPAGDTERLMICLTEHPAAAALIRRGKRVADRLRAECHVVYVARDASWSTVSAEDRQQVERHFELAQGLDMLTEVLYGRDVAATLVSFARDRKVTQMILGHTIHAGWLEFLRGNIIERILRLESDIDIHVVADR